MSEEVIQQYLVYLGAKVDEPAWKKFTEFAKANKVMLMDLGFAAAAAGVAVTVAVEQIARRYEDLYYASQRTRSSVTGLLSFEYAARQIGLTAGQARGAVESFSSSLRMSPGLQGLLGSMGIGKGEGVDQLHQLIGKLRESFGEQGYYAAARVGGLFGIDEQTFKMLWNGFDESEMRGRRYQQMVREAGLDQDKMSKDSVRLGRSLNELGAAFDILGSKILSKFIGPLESATGAASNAVVRLAGGKLINRDKADFLTGFTMASPTLSAFNWLMGGGDTGAPMGAAPTQLGRTPSIAFPSNHGAAGGKVARDAVVDFFVQQGWTKEQAYGIAANISAESGFNPKGSGDRGKAYGLAQWHPDRQADFAGWAGHDITASTAEEQLQFIQYELTQGKEQNAGRMLRGARNAREAGAAFSYAYERPLAAGSAMQERGALAETWAHQGATTNNISITINGPGDEATVKRGVAAGLEAQQRRQLVRSDNMR
jgi:hypothetical protein